MTNTKLKKTVSSKNAIRYGRDNRNLVIIRLLLSIMCSVIMFVSVSTYVFAATVRRVALNELEMSIAVPSDYILFTRNTSENDPDLLALGLTQSDISEYLQSEALYLDAMDREGNLELQVAMLDTTVDDFNELTDAELMTIAEFFCDESENAGALANNYEVYHNSQGKFIKTDLIMKNGDYKSVYYTVYNEKVIFISLFVFSEKADAFKEKTMETIIDTIVIGKDYSTTMIGNEPTTNL